MESLNNIQEDLKLKIIKARSNFRKSPKDRLTQAYIETRLENLERLWSLFTDTHTKIISTVPKTERLSSPYTVTDMYDQTEEVYVEYKTDLKELLAGFVKDKSPNSQTLCSRNDNQHVAVKLPMISIPCFSGKYTEWSSFRDLFTSLVHNNESLDDVQRLHYLKSHLTGEPEQLLRQVPITHSNYKVCWEQLEKRYNNKRYLANCILKRLMSQKSLISESSNAIKEILDTTSECLSALGNLGIDVASWDIIVIHIICLKLDSESRKLWEIKISEFCDDLPTIKQFNEFLEQRFRSLEFLDNKATKTSYSSNRMQPNNVKALHVTTASCPFCNDSHKLYACKKFAKNDVNTRRGFVQTQNLCFNCLGSNHSAIACRHPTRCRICHRKHHSLLHESNYGQRPNEVSSSVDNSTNQGTVSTASTSQGDTNQAITSCFSNMHCQVLLATALINIESRTGASITFRSMLDQGSQASFITESAVQLLGLKKTASKSCVSVLGSDTSPSVVSKHVVNIKLQSLHDSNFVIRVQALVLSKLTNFLPNKQVTAQLSQFAQLSLADPTYATPNKVDLILGAKVYSQILKEGLIKDPSSCIIAQNTSLGWIISGETDEPSAGDSISCNNTIITMHAQINDIDLLRQFWEMESEPTDVKAKKHLTEEEQQCEKIYTSTTTRDALGRYIVKLPFRKEPKCIEGNSKDIALKRLLSVERKLSKDLELKQKYAEVFNEYLTLGHMELVPVEEQEKTNMCYLPHLVVVRDDKITTKVRIVFDASCPGTNGVSLNNDLMVGPTIQEDLRHILMRWRTHPICLTSDIVKMYRQVLISPEDCDFQRVLWRDDPNDEVKQYRLLRVTFGTSSAPYLAIRTLQQVAHDEGANFHKAAEKVLSDFYVDDLMSGCQTVSEGKQIYKEMKHLLTKGGFELQKWTTNDKELMQWMKSKDENGVKQEPETEKTRLEIKTDDVTKILGLTWNRSNDVFKYSVQLPPMDPPVTKRKVISDISRLYDPLGWISLVTIKAKIIIQKLWISGIQWDEELTHQLLTEWITYRNELAMLTEYEIPRWINTRLDDSSIQLHGFCDASNEAFAAVVYIRVVDSDGNVHVHLITSKTKVAPIRQISIPRLELCGAVLLTKLLIEVADVLAIPKQQAHAWTDSMVVLAWLSSHPSRWKVFVANRVSEILNGLDRSQWSHVQSKENPADCASRGVMPSDQHKLQFWKNGPNWLRNKDIGYGENVANDTNEEERSIKAIQAMPSLCDNVVWEKFSTLRRLVRVISWCKRFIASTNKRESTKYPQWLTSKELQEAFTTCIRQYQKLSFQEEIKSIEKQGIVKKKSKLTSLSPFVDPEGVLRVGGRLDKAAISESRKHPIILSGTSHLTGLIIAEAHEKTMHGGPQIMMNYLRSKYWIIDMKNQVKRYVRSCIKCVRHAAQKREQLMGQLPIARVTPNRPFKQSGVDYAGPFNLRTTKGRGHRAYKGYICLFVCMVTRAIHLEVVSDLTAKGFLAAFKRFVARRGHCAELFSDNGTNFVGSARELKLLLGDEKSGLVPEIANWLSSNGTNWHFIPVQSPNFGGLWESGIKSTKHHLKRVMSNSTLTYEEMSTVLAQIEACLNSRPMSSLSTVPNDPMPLTPGHFLVGEPLVLPPDTNYESSNISCLKRWQLTQRMVQEFWRKWSEEYLTQFLHRYKWSYQTPEPNIGDVVLVKEDNLPPARWLYGIIIDKHPGMDQITRVVSLKCNGNIIKRPTSKLCILPVTK